MRSNVLIQHFCPGGGRGVAFHCSGDCLLGFGQDGEFRIWDLRGGRILHRRNEHEGPSSVSMSGCNFASGGFGDKLVKLWRIDMLSLPHHKDCGPKPLCHASGISSSETFHCHVRSSFCDCPVFEESVDENNITRNFK
mmetsp:Transcript_24074/g.54723  ORF Transcript_24074/g.54723 Transcript_24074/m.54723 type:complete len:138 (-) Transcript_24074:666-1079(-)